MNNLQGSSGKHHNVDTRHHDLYDKVEMATALLERNNYGFPHQRNQPTVTNAQIGEALMDSQINLLTEAYASEMKEGRVTFIGMGRDITGVFYDAEKDGSRESWRDGQLFISRVNNNVNTPDISRELSKILGSASNKELQYYIRRTSDIRQASLDLMTPDGH